MIDIVSTTPGGDSASQSRCIYGAFRRVVGPWQVMVHRERVDVIDCRSNGWEWLQSWLGSMSGQNKRWQFFSWTGWMGRQYFVPFDEKLHLLTLKQ